MYFARKNMKVGGIRVESYGLNHAVPFKAQFEIYSPVSK